MFSFRYRVFFCVFLVVVSLFSGLMMYFAFYASHLQHSESVVRRSGIDHIIQMLNLKARATCHLESLQYSDCMAKGPRLLAYCVHQQKGTDEGSLAKLQLTDVEQQQYRLVSIFGIIRSGDVASQIPPEFAQRKNVSKMLLKKQGVMSKIDAAAHSVAASKRYSYLDTRAVALHSSNKFNIKLDLDLDGNPNVWSGVPDDLLPSGHLTSIGYMQMHEIGSEIRNAYLNLTSRNGQVTDINLYVSSRIGNIQVPLLIRFCGNTID